MKICQLCAVDFTLYHFLLPLMEAERAAGHEVIGACAHGPWLKEVEARGFRTMALPFERSFNLIRHRAAYRALVERLHTEKFDLVHVHTPIAALIGRLAARRARVPRIVYTAHGFYFHEHMAAPKRLAFLGLEWLGGRATDVLFTQAEEDAATARRFGLCKGGVIEAIGNGVDAARFRPAADDGAARRKLRESIGTPEHTIVVLMIGRLVAEKGYPELFEAMHGLNAELWVAGERLPSDHARAIAPPSDLSNVKLLGHRRDVPELLRAADVFVLPSHREGMPRSIIEAMMTGIPVVATDIRGSREEVVHEETGLLVPVRDARALHAALGRLIEAPELRQRFGVAGRARALRLFDERLVIARQLRTLGLMPENLDDATVEFT
ncbi:MAG: glycosyltransferase family 4 protein [Alphaproteobacteria bacterium]|nr:glycosyltransferase family 4 protein [Alphaproteobacteria bacterium]